MFSASRRAFLGASLAGLASAPLFGAAPPAAPFRKGSDDAPFQPSTLFLTWQRDPTTTMTVQWVGTAGETADTRVYYSASRSSLWYPRPTTARPYPQSDFKVYRAELTGLTPGSDYLFRIGKE